MTEFAATVPHVLSRVDNAGSSKIIIDLRGSKDLESFWDKAREVGIKLESATLEQAVTAIAGARAVENGR